MVNYYKKIKYIVQDSFYESCSNVKIEGLFNGCNTNIQNRYKYQLMICSTQYPYYGGGSTIAYKTHKFFLNLGYNCKCCFFLTNNEHKKIINNSSLINPSNLSNVYFSLSKKMIINTIELLKLAENIICVNYGIIPMIRKITTGKLIYQIIGSPELTLGDCSPISKSISYVKFCSDHKNYIDDIKNTRNAKLNYESLKYSDYIYANSIHTYKIYRLIYPEFEHKLKINLNTSEYEIFTSESKINETVEYFPTKKYKLISVSSNWNRKVKNVSLVYNLYKIFSSHTKIIIGSRNKDYDFTKIENTEVFDNIDNEKIS